MRIGFHSYKGGTGRTRIMVAAGALLAMKGYRVALLDFDLDASGLVTIFNGDTTAISKNELLNFLNDGAASYHRVPDAMLDITNEFLGARFDLPDDDENVLLKYLPTITDPELSDGLVLDNLATKVDELLEEVLEASCDIVLVDVKPGFSPSFKALVPCLDHLVFVSRIDQENIVGLQRLASKVKNTRRIKTVHLVANMVPAHDLTEQHFNKLEAAVAPAGSVRIGYHPELTFDYDLKNLGAPDSPIAAGVGKLVKMLLRDE